MRPHPLRRAYLGMQARKMFEYERDVCRSVAHVIAVSDADAELMRSMFGVASVSAVPTGVDIEYFTPSRCRCGPRGSGLRRVHGLAAEH